MEVSRRGPCSGGLGGVSFTGDMDIALVLRMLGYAVNGLLTFKLVLV
jgi:anthranilate/para-aminobenzoate synthase component I